jgi:hypothetical protein
MAQVLLLNRFANSDSNGVTITITLKHSNKQLKGTAHTDIQHRSRQPMQPELKNPHSRTALPIILLKSKGWNLKPSAL